jgi:hypothetical protein
MKVQDFRSHFLAGEVSPKVQSRTDLERYANALETLENFIVRPTGGLEKRDGTLFVCETKDTTNPVRLIPFEWAEDETFVLEFGNQYIRFIHEGAQIKAGGGSELVTNGTFAADPFGGGGGWADVDTGTGVSTWNSTPQNVSLNGGTSGKAMITTPIACTIGNLYRVKFEVVTDNPVWISIGSGADPNDHLYSRGFYKGVHQVSFKAHFAAIYISFSNSNNYLSYIDNVSCKSATPYEVATTYTGNEVLDIQVSEDNRVLYITHPLHAPASLTRTEDDSWTLANCAFIDGPYLPEASASITAAATTGTNVQFTSTTPVWTSGMVGSLMRFHDDGRWAYGRIFAYETSQHVHIDILTTMPSTSLSKYREGCWSDYRGWPRAINFFEGRLILAGTTYQPQTFWGSKTGEPLNFKEGSLDDRSFAFTIACRSRNYIYWLATENRELIAGTMSGPVRLSGGEDNPISPTNPRSDQAMKRGCYPKQPLEVENHIIYLQRSGKKLRSLLYSWQENQYRAPEVTKGADQVAVGGIVDYAYQEEPHSVLWAVRADGRLVGMTYDTEDGIFAWHQHPLRGSEYVERVACIHSQAGIPTENPDYAWSQHAMDEVYLVTRRIISGTAKRFIERLNPDTRNDCSFIRYRKLPI